MAQSISGGLVFPEQTLPGTMHRITTTGVGSMAAPSGQSLSGPTSSVLQTHDKKLCEYFFWKINYKGKIIYMDNEQVKERLGNVFPDRKWCQFGTRCRCSHSLSDEQKKHAKEFMHAYTCYAVHCGKYLVEPSLCDFLGVKLDKCGFLSSSQNNHNTEPDDGQMCKFFFKEIVYPVPSNTHSEEWEERRVYITQEECIQFCHCEYNRSCKFGANCTKQHKRTDAQIQAAKHLCELTLASFCTPLDDY